MNMILWLVGRFFPMQEEGGDEPGEQSPDGRPAHVPEKFWDPDVGIRVDELAKGYNELEGLMRTKTDDLRTQIEADRMKDVPDKYDFKLPEDLKVPNGVELDLNADDPLLQWFEGFAKQVGLSQDSYNEAIKAYIEAELAGMPNVEDEIRKLGQNGNDRVQTANAKLDEILAEDEKAIVAEMLTTAAGVGVLEKLLKISGPENFEGDAGSAPLTLEELRKIQADPRYYADHDPELIRKVRAGYARLYPDG